MNDASKPEAKKKRKNPKTKKKLKQPKFRREDVEKLVDTLRSRWTYELANEWEMAFSLTSRDEKTNVLFDEFSLDAANPFHWRALLEAFTRNYVRYDGRPIERTTIEKVFELALDLCYVDNTEPFGPTDAAVQLQRAQKDKYSKYGLDNLRKLVEEIIKLIGPIDDDTPDRLIVLDRERFVDAVLKRAGTTQEDLRKWR